MSLEQECSCTDFIPVIKHEHCPPACHHVSICKVYHLLQEPMSEDLHEQHIYYLSEFIKACSEGFYVTDLPFLTRVLETLTERLQKVPRYRSSLKKLLRIAAIPPILHNANEELTGVLAIAEYISILGLLALWLVDKKLRFIVYKSLQDLLNCKEQRSLAYIRPALCYIAIDNSYLPEIVSQLLEFVPYDEYFDILKIAAILVQISQHTCQQMIRAHAIDFLLLKLIPEPNVQTTLCDNTDPDEVYEKMLNTTCHILLHLVRNLKGVDEEILKNLIPSRDAFWALRLILRAEVLKGHRKLCRNNLMEFLLICLNTFPQTEYVNTGLADDIIILSIATELGAKNTWAQAVKFKSDEYDISFKKMLLISLKFLEKYPQAARIIEERQLIPGLITLLSPQYQYQWHPEEQITIMKITLAVLCNIAPKFLDIFLNFNGPFNLLVIIESSMQPLDVDKEVLEGSLKTMAKYLQTRSEKLGLYLKCHMAYSVIQLFCNNILDKPAINSMDQRYLGFSFCILEYLCGYYPSAENSGLSLVAKYFKRVSEPNSEDSPLNSRTVICAIDFLWAVILQSEIKLKAFIKMNGVFLLLDVIQMSCLPVQAIGLACLVDICEDGTCIPYLLTWRGGENRKMIFYSLLAQIFRNECKKLGTRLSDEDIIIDSFMPLMGKNQYKETFSTNKDRNSSPAIADMLGSCRPKVYALIQMLKTRYQDKVELTNEHYKISYSPICPRDQMILTLAENFMALKLSEVWNEIVNDMINACIVPVNLDSQMLNLLSERMLHWNTYVRTKQQNILDKDKQKGEMEEKEFYELIRKCTMSEATEALRQLQFIARTTDRMFMLAHKKRQRDEINNALQFPKSEDCTMYRTFMEKIDVTTVFHLDYNLIYNEEKHNTV